MATDNPFANLEFDDFRRMALDTSLSCHEKVGFPDAYRKDKESCIFADIAAKLTNLSGVGGTVLEIGPGCGPLPVMLMELCAQRQHNLILVDSAEMLGQLPDSANVLKIPGEFPELPQLLDQYAESVDAVLAYSVLQYAHGAGNTEAFVAQALRLLRAQGQMLLGDLPNSSMRRRFFDSAAGIAAHQAYTGIENPPPVKEDDKQSFDDAAILGLVGSIRDRGFDAWILQQAPQLPMANRREDILVVKP